MAVGICYALYARLRKGESMRAIRAIAVLLCAALLLPMCGCTEREPNLFMDVEKIAETYRGVELESGTDAMPTFTVDLDWMESFEWVRHLTTTESLCIHIKRGTAEKLALPDLSPCGKLKALTVYSSYFRSTKGTRARVQELDLSSVSGSGITYLKLEGLEDTNIELGDGVETIVFQQTVPDMEKLATMQNLGELQIYSDEPFDLTPLGSSESLHLLHLGMVSKSWQYKKLHFPEWDLSPLKGSNVDTLLLGTKLSTKLLESLDGAENIRHLQINRTDITRGIDNLDSLPNLESVAVFGFAGSNSFMPDKTFVSSKKDKDTIDYIAGSYGSGIVDTLERFVERGGTVVGWNMSNWEDCVMYGIEGGVSVPMTDKYYEWYYQNVD